MGTDFKKQMGYNILIAAYTAKNKGTKLNFVPLCILNYSMF